MTQASVIHGSVLGKITCLTLSLEYHRWVGFSEGEITCRTVVGGAHN